MTISISIVPALSLPVLPATNAEADIQVYGSHNIVDMTAAAASDTTLKAAKRAFELQVTITPKQSIWRFWNELYSAEELLHKMCRESAAV